MWNVEIEADSINPNGHRITTYVLTFPRLIHSELMTHRVFSRNAASSRAIPIDKMIEAVVTDPAMPIRWGSNGKGMQDHGLLSGAAANAAYQEWRRAATDAVTNAKALQATGAHKQIVNRVLEPFMWMTVIVTATEWENFFKLRCHPDAQPEFQHLAHLMLQHYLYVDPETRQTPRKPWPAQWGEWHIPFDPQFKGKRVSAELPNITLEQRIVTSVACCARVSYTKHNVPTYTPDKDAELYHQLLASGHMSPFEHVAQALAKWTSSNFHGWEQHRKQVARFDTPNGFKLSDHLAWYEKQKSS